MLEEEVFLLSMAQSKHAKHAAMKDVPTMPKKEVSLGGKQCVVCYRWHTMNDGVTSGSGSG